MRWGPQSQTHCDRSCFPRSHRAAGLRSQKETRRRLFHQWERHDSRSLGFRGHLLSPSCHADRCHRNGLRFTPVVFGGRAGGCGVPARNVVTWISHRLRTTSLRTPSDRNLELAQRISAALHRDSARAILRRSRLAASREAPTPLSVDPDPVAWSTGFDSLTEICDDESFSHLPPLHPSSPPRHHLSLSPWPDLLRPPLRLRVPFPTSCLAWRPLCKFSCSSPRTSWSSGSYKGERTLGTTRLPQPITTRRRIFFVHSGAGTGV